ncbi:MAG TPA: hypothetical protein VJ692_07380 [Nitrospiraceae bacterium]|nr:hypothetical protein [Nitrospiraceae bacterium]
MIDPEKYKDTPDDVVIVNPDNVIRLSASMVAQESPEEIRRQLRRVYEGMFRKRRLQRRT